MTINNIDYDKIKVRKIEEMKAFKKSYDEAVKNGTITKRKIKEKS